jgi:hypothetical protein
MSGVLNWVNEWHRRACPQPDDKAFNVQLGCHLEEIAEMLAWLNGSDVKTADILKRTMHHVDALAQMLKHGSGNAIIADRREFLDSLADQIVTATGVGYRAKMDVPNAVTEVDISNWSKFDENGQPILNEFGKIAKGPNYKPPVLDGLY